MSFLVHKSLEFKAQFNAHGCH